MQAGLRHVCVFFSFVFMWVAVFWSFANFPVVEWVITFMYPLERGLSRFLPVTFVQFSSCGEMGGGA